MPLSLPVSSLPGCSSSDSTRRHEICGRSLNYPRLRPSPALRDNIAHGARCYPYSSTEKSSTLGILLLPIDFVSLFEQARRLLVCTRSASQCCSQRHLVVLLCTCPHLLSVSLHHVQSRYLFLFFPGFISLFFVYCIVCSVGETQNTPRRQRQSFTPQSLILQR